MSRLDISDREQHAYMQPHARDKTACNVGLFIVWLIAGAPESMRRRTTFDLAAKGEPGSE